jgi:hypothetical protein
MIFVEVDSMNISSVRGSVCKGVKLPDRGGQQLLPLPGGCPSSESIEWIQSIGEIAVYILFEKRLKVLPVKIGFELHVVQLLISFKRVLHQGV